MRGDMCMLCGGHGHNQRNCPSNNNAQAEKNLTPNEVIFKLNQDSDDVIDESNLSQIENVVAEAKTIANSLYQLIQRVGLEA